MLARNEKGRLVFNRLDFEILIGELYSKCETEDEVEWLEEQLQSIIECSAEERIDELG